MRSSHTVEYRPAIKRMGGLTLATTWTGLKNMLHGIGQSQKDKFYVTPLTEVPGFIRVTENRGRIEISRGCRSGTRRSCLMGTEFQFGMMTTFWRRMDGYATKENVLNATVLCT